MFKHITRDAILLPLLMLLFVALSKSMTFANANRSTPTTQSSRCPQSTAYYLSDVKDPALSPTCLSKTRNLFFHPFFDTGQYPRPQEYIATAELQYGLEYLTRHDCVDAKRLWQAAFSDEKSMFPDLPDIGSQHFIKGAYSSGFTWYLGQYRHGYGDWVSINDTQLVKDIEFGLQSGHSKQYRDAVSDFDNANIDFPFATDAFYFKQMALVAEGKRAQALAVLALSIRHHNPNTDLRETTRLLTEGALERVKNGNLCATPTDF